METTSIQTNETRDFFISMVYEEHDQVLFINLVLV